MLEYSRFSNYMSDTHPFFIRLLKGWVSTSCTKGSPLLRFSVFAPLRTSLPELCSDRPTSFLIHLEDDFSSWCLSSPSSRNFPLLSMSALVIKTYSTPPPPWSPQYSLVPTPGIRNPAFCSLSWAEDAPAQSDSTTLESGSGAGSACPTRGCPLNSLAWSFMIM